MMKKLLILVLYIYPLVSLSVLADQHPKVLLNKKFEWVKDHNIDYTIEYSNLKINNGVYYFLLDNQIHVENQTTYTNIVKKIINKSGIENFSDINISFDPAYQKLYLHKINIIRNGKILNKLDQSRLKIIQREIDLDNNIYDGKLSVIQFIEDLRIGDIIDYSYSLTGFNPIFNDKFTTSFLLQYNFPVQLISNRILCSKNRLLKIKNIHTPLQYIKNYSKGIFEYIWEIQNSKSIKIEPNTPDWFNPYPRIQVSEFLSWESVIDWGISTFEYPNQQSSEVSKIIQKYSKPEYYHKPRIICDLLKDIQKNIRYLGIEFGENSHKPSTPSTVLQRKYGDCKDKSFLFSYLLKELGIYSYVALVNTYNKEKIDQYLPSPYVFNHAVVYVELDNKSYWLDPTLSFQEGNLENIYFPDYKRALILKKDNTNLSVINFKNNSSIVINEIFNIRSYEKSATLTVDEKYYGEKADFIRNVISSVDAEKFSQGYIDYYSGIYPEIKINKLPEHKDNKINNEVIISSEYLIPNAWYLSSDKKTYNFDFFCKNINDFFFELPNANRKMPYYLSYPLSINVTAQLNLPEYWKINDDRLIIDNENIFFKYTLKNSDKEITLSYEYKNKHDHINPENIKQYIQNRNEISNSLSLSLHIRNFLGIKDDLNDFKINVSTSKNYYSSWRFLVPLSFAIVIFLQFIVPLHFCKKYQLHSNIVLFSYIMSFIVSLSIQFYSFYQVPDSTFLYIFIIFLVLMINQLKQLIKL